MERIINYTVGIDDIHPKSPQFAGVQGEHRVTAIALSFSDEFAKSLENQKHFWDYIQFRIDYTDSLGNMMQGETLDIDKINEPYYLTRIMTKAGGNTSAVLKIFCFNAGGTEKEFYTGIMRLYFDSCPSVLLADDEQGSILSPIVNQARNYRNEAYDSARVSVESENVIKVLTEENRSLNEKTQNNTQIVLETVQKVQETEGKLNDANEILAQCQEATSLAKDAATGVVTIEQNKKIPLKISVMTQEEYDNAIRPDPDGCATLDLIEDDGWVNFIYPVGSIYMSVNNVEPSTLFGGSWERIKDRFLLSCGDTYSANTTGGEAEHTLTVEEMPSHTHQICGEDLWVMTTKGGTYRKHGIATGGTIDNVLTNAEEVGRADNLADATGNGKPHNNMPPYLAVYMWKRIA